jgi:hypothetical protein
MNKTKFIPFFEVTGSALAIVYAMLIASNTGNEMLGFALLLVSSGLFAAWGLIDRRWAFLLLQFFYAASAIIGMVQWS